LLRRYEFPAWRALPLMLLLGSGALQAQSEWPLERLFTRPYTWGTRPEKITWSRKGHTLVLLWNAEGNRFLDLYGYDPAGLKLSRLTDMAGREDPLTRSAAEKDDRQKAFVAPAEGIADFDLSRDGGRAAFSYRGDLYVAGTDGAAPPLQLTRTKAAETAPRFSPDGKRLAFLRDGQVQFIDLATGQLWQVTDTEEGSTVNAFRWSPDGGRFLYTVRGGGGRRVLLPNYSGRLVTVAPFARSLAGDRANEARTYVIAARGGAARLLEPGPWGAQVYTSDTPEWSPDGTRILESVVHPGMKQAQLLVHDATTGKTVVIAAEKDAAWVEPMWAAWSPDGRRVVYSSDRDGWEHLYIVAREGGPAVQITRGAWETHVERGVGHDPQWIGEWIYYGSTEAGTSERQFYRVRPDGSGKERLSTGEGVRAGVVSEDGRHTALLQADLRNPFDLWVDGRRVTESPRPDFARYSWPETRFVSFPSRGDGKAVAAKLLLPPGYRPEARGGKAWPAVFFIHGSGYATSVLKQWGSYQEQRYVFNCWLANHGYVVMDLDYRVSSGYGRDWRTGIYQHLGGGDLDDVLGAVECMRGLGNIDMARIGIWGSSYGGFMTAMAMFQAPDVFRAGASFSSVNDWENYNAFYTEQRLGKPQDNPEAYRRSSPIHFSSMLRNPLLIVHGMVDNNVMFQDAVQLSEKLIHEGKRFEQIYYPEESHMFVRDETPADAFRRAAEFFDRNLK
jgi:dipeptidyl aminopeptidase/acylaminoacyl peptidase